MEGRREEEEREEEGRREGGRTKEEEGERRREGGRTKEEEGERRREDRRRERGRRRRKEGHDFSNCNKTIAFIPSNSTYQKKKNITTDVPLFSYLTVRGQLQLRGRCHQSGCHTPHSPQ